ncbi:MAG: GUN4 N-terminal ARM-like repeat domain-containing protein [Cyanobacteria bacterium P01_A01_bin.17]
MDASATSVEHPDIAELESQLTTGSEKTQLPVMAQLQAAGADGCQVLQRFLLSRRQDAATFIDGRAYELLLQAEADETQTFLQENFPTGVVALNSEVGADYLPLQKLLARQQFEEADRLTLHKLCELEGPVAVKRKWIYFTQIEQFPIPDLQTLDRLWVVHSEGKFGFSIQRQLWLSLGRNWEALWSKIDWRTGRDWTRYPDGFTWDLTAPKGHLPLSNQLRGVQVMNALLNHPAWKS